jgi:uncharacterized membrane protein YdjX (TVP38/TMEM64 family)
VSDAAKPAGNRPARRAAALLSLPNVMTLLVVGGGALWLAASPAARDFVATAARLLLRFDVKGLRDLLAPWHGRAWILTSLLMVLQSLAAPIPAVPITLANALIYGPWLGALISWSSAEVAAAICFLLARSLGRPFVARLFSKRALEKTDAFFAQEGLRAVLVLRLIPYVSFDVVSYAAGLTSMALVPFLIATGIGQAPATLAYSWAGAHLADDVSFAWKIGLGFVGAVALLVALVAWRRRAKRAKQVKQVRDATLARPAETSRSDDDAAGGGV